MIFTDSHCHLTMSDAEPSSRARARRAIRGFVVPGTKLDDAPEAVAVAQKHDDVWAAVGFHPHEAKDCDDAAFAEIERLSTQPRVVAIGECGLDYHYMHSPRETQIAVLRAASRSGQARRQADHRPQPRVGRRHGEHSLGQRRARDSAFVHGVEEIARKFIDAGYYISFSGIVTFRTAEPLRACASALPHDRVLIETDTPFLAPVPYRGRDNEPAYVIKVAELLATLWGIPVEEVAAITTANFEKAFGVTLSA